MQQDNKLCSITQTDLSFFSYGKQSLEASRFYGWLFYFC